MKGQVEYAYVYLLGVYPLASFLIQDVIMGKALVHQKSHGNNNSKRLNKTTTWWQAVLLRAVLWIGFASVAETMQVANGASLSLRDTCRSNLLLPKIHDAA